MVFASAACPKGYRFPKTIISYAVYLYHRFICRLDGRDWRSVKDVFPEFRSEVHVYGRDPSLRCFHIDLNSANGEDAVLGLRLIASSGTDLVGYHGYIEELPAAEGVPDL